MAIHDYSMIDLIGNTPLVRLSKLEKKYNLSSPLYAKLERCNPTGSIKDRAAKEMILHALQEGKINQDTLLIEPTSGNTGIGLAAIAATLGMKLVIFMPASASIERVKMMKAFGADCRLVKEGGMSGCIKEAEELHKQYPNSFIPAQFDNENNALAHYKTTGPEIYKQTEGELDIFVTSFGTGGTLTGISRYLKEQNKEIKTIGVEPASSACVSKGVKGAHKIQGIGAGFKPSILDLNYVDEVMTIQDEEAYQVTRELAQVEGLFVGISAGCNVAAAIKVAKENPNKVIVTVLPDNGERYLSVEGLFE
jgi:cysteine synthase A